MKPPHKTPPPPPPPAPPPSRVRMLLVTDVRLVREALALWFRGQGPVQLMAVVGHRDAALAAARELRPPPDLALIDMRMPDGVELAQTLALACPALKLVGFGLSETEDNVLRYAGAGFAGYAPREMSLADLVEVLQGIARGEVRYSRRITTTLLHRLASVVLPSGGVVQLTPRETEIARLIDDGLSNREIARRLAIGITTVKNHVHHLLEKLKVSRRGEAVARLRHPGQLPPPPAPRGGGVLDRRI
jgi:two-component system, NarL family, nitrate/nitrite response regulator NarL